MPQSAQSIGESSMNIMEPTLTSTQSSESGKGDVKDVLTEATQYLSHGKRHLLVQDYMSAAASLQEACRLFDEMYGVGAQECGEAYLLYGTAMLEEGRAEIGVLDGVVQANKGDVSENETADEDTEGNEDGVDDDGEEEEEADGDDKPDNDKIEKEGEENAIKEVKEVDEEDTLKVKQSESCEASGSAGVGQTLNYESCQPSTSAGTSSGASGSKPNTETDDEEEEDEEVNSLEISWEVLCLAKEIFEKSIEKEGFKLKLAETLQKLGEISIEWENNVNAVDLLTRCLSYRKEVLPEDDRLIAETHYHLGLAYSFSNQCENANNSFLSAIQVFEKRIDNQRKLIAATPSDSVDLIKDAEKEIRQLEELLPEMRSKIEDSQDQMENVKKALNDEANEKKKEEALAVKTQEISKKPVTDISHLLKRKRPDSESNSSPKKLLCTNGDNNGNMNNSANNKQESCSSNPAE